MLVIEAGLKLASRPCELLASQIYLYELWLSKRLTKKQKEAIRNNDSIITSFETRESMLRKTKNLRELYVGRQNRHGI
nr:MAG: hypothetical protein [Helarchaeota virus Nidhogg Meg22_1012]